jgi:hypothetical protein
MPYTDNESYNSSNDYIITPVYMCAHAESTNKAYTHLLKLIVKIGAELNNSDDVLRSGCCLIIHV